MEQAANWPLDVVAEVFGVGPQALTRWQRRLERGHKPCGGGRPLVINESARSLIRECYLAHFQQWGPCVLADWCRRESIGDWNPGTIASVIADLRPDKEPKADPIRFEVTASKVMWSEDGTGFKEKGRKKELLVLQDDHARLKVDWELVRGPATSVDVEKYLRRPFERLGAPLVLKHDNDGIFHTPGVARLLKEYEVLDLTSPVDWPGYNGKQERSMRDIKSYERAMRKHGIMNDLQGRIERTMQDLNVDRPRPCLGGLTASEAYERGLTKLPSRRMFRRAVEAKEAELLEAARSRNEVKRARRQAIEQTLVSYGLLEITGEVSHDFL